MVDGVRQLTADAVIQLGGWHPRYARVVLIDHNHHDGVVLVDGNGDGAELELEYWHRGDDGFWVGRSSSGHGPLAFLPSTQTWSAGHFVVAVGSAQPGAEVLIEYGGRLHNRMANEFGTWGFVHAANSPQTGELPAVVIQSPPAA